MLQGNAAGAEHYVPNAKLGLNCPL